MRITFAIKFLALIILPVVSDAQDKKTFKSNFYEAEYFFLNGDYNEAAFLYTELLKIDPVNYNIHFLLGASYLSIEGLKTKAIPHLEKSVTSISAGYREGSYRETNSPRVALFALARAYHINNQFDDAIEYYEKYKRVMKISDVAEVEYVNKQIASVKLAKDYIRDTVYFEYSVICEAFTAENSNYRAVFAEKDSILVFMTDKPFYTGVMMSNMKNGTWSDPLLINDQLKIEGKFNLCSISFDGTELYFSVNFEFNWDLYVSYYENGSWSPIQALDKTINTKYNETHASLTRDKRRMYFTSDRPGGMGAMDIYYTERDHSGNWGTPVNLEKPVNTIYSEETPFPASDGKTLYFSSMSHATMGGFDIFYTTMLPNNNWSYPANLGYPVNTTDDDMFFVPLGNGKMALYTPESGILPQRKILALTLDPVSEDWKYAFRGLVTTEDKLELDSSTVLNIVDTEKNINIARLKPETGTGEFNAEIPPGNYKLTVEAEGYEPASEFISVLPQHSMKNIEIEKTLTPTRVSSGEYALASSVLFGFNSYDLAEPAKFELEKLYRLMSEDPHLYVEVTGFTDAIGSSEYNLQLAQKRSAEVVNYLISKGIPRESFISRAAGKTGFIALNVNEDGTDNPEGRKFNRRVEINLVNRGDRNIVMNDILVPEHLKPQASKQYYVILDERETAHKNLPASIANKDIKLFETGRKFIYAAGIFNTRHDATKFLINVIDIDFPESRIISEEDFNYLLKPSVPDLAEVKGPFTIQILALKTPVRDDFLKPSDKVIQIEGKDDIYRYISGVYNDYTEAQKQLVNLIKSGYTDAFINQLSRYALQNMENESESPVDFYYTIQFSALKKPSEPGNFKGIENIILSRGNDGYYRYSTGIFLGRNEAEKELMKIKDIGFRDAFIRKVGGE